MLKFLIELWQQYGAEIITLFIAWVLRKLEKPQVEKKAVKNFVEFLKVTKAERLKNGAIAKNPEELFSEFLAENPQYKERKKSNRSA